MAGITSDCLGMFAEGCLNLPGGKLGRLGCHLPIMPGNRYGERSCMARASWSRSMVLGLDKEFFQGNSFMHARAHAADDGTSTATRIQLHIHQVNKLHIRPRCLFLERARWCNGFGHSPAFDIDLRTWRPLPRWTTSSRSRIRGNHERVTRSTSRVRTCMNSPPAQTAVLTWPAGSTAGANAAISDLYPFYAAELAG